MKYDLKKWLPTTMKEVKLRAWEQLDIILFTGDAYIDHPSFGAAVIGRTLEAEGYKVAIIPQANWRDDLRDFKKLGKPRLFFGVTSGNMDSMVNHYTANKRLRSNDAYTPDGKAGYRPDYATTVYSKILKEIYPDVPVIIGGIEASLRRFTHYDYWSNSLKSSILYESKADLLVYGNGEQAIKEIAGKLNSGTKIDAISDVKQTSYLSSGNEKTADMISLETHRLLYSHEECLNDKKKFAENFKHIEIESNKKRAKVLIQEVSDKYVFVNPPFTDRLDTEIDKTYSLPYTRLPHPKYNKRGDIPAYEMIKFSINIHRGCFGGCSFCTISAHQGKFIVSRSEKSILEEVEQVTKMPDFKGYISDIGGPSANMYKMEGYDLEICNKCTRPSCIFPKICTNLNINHSKLTSLYKKINDYSGVKKAFIGSGIRYDMLIDKNNEIKGDKLKYTEQLVKHHVSGRLKIAPEHTEDGVLEFMRKPTFKLFYTFKQVFDKINIKSGLKQQLIPYFISSHPACTDTDMAELAVKTKKLNFKLEQVQDLTPTPMTLSAVVFYSGYHPYTLKKVYTAKSKEQKLSQKMFFFGYKKEYRNKIKHKLQSMKRPDLLKKLLK